MLQWCLSTSYSLPPVGGCCIKGGVIGWYGLTASKQARSDSIRSYFGPMCVQGIITNCCCLAAAGSLVKSIYPRDYEMTEETRKQIPKFVWPMRTEKWDIWLSNLGHSFSGSPVPILRVWVKVQKSSMFNAIEQKVPSPLKNVQCTTYNYIRTEVSTFLGSMKPVEKIMTILCVWVLNVHCSENVQHTYVQTCRCVHTYYYTCCMCFFCMNVFVGAHVWFWQARLVASRDDEMMN